LTIAEGGVFFDRIDRIFGLTGFFGRGWGLDGGREKGRGVILGIF
jgi:hypothetical protein